MKEAGSLHGAPALVLAALLALSSMTSAEEAGIPARTLTWTQCVREAAMGNPGIQAAEKAVQKNDLARKAAYSTFLPQLNATSGVSRAQNEQNSTSVVTSGQSLSTSFGTPTSQASASNIYSIQLSLEQTIFDGFSTRGNVDKARAEAGVALAKLLTQKSTASYELKSAFAQLLYAQELIGISQNIIDQRELNCRLVELKYENGRENKGAMLLSKANLNQARVNLTQAHRTLRVSQIQLLTVMGRTALTSVVAKGELVTGKPQENPDFQGLALKTPSHFQQVATVEAAKAGITIAQSDFYPQISAYANVSSQSKTSFEAPKSWEVGLDGSWAIFNGGQSYFNVREARTSLESERFTLRKTDADNAQTLAEDYRSYRDAIENAGVVAQLLEANQLRVKIADAQYRNGLISFQDFDTITNSSISQQQTELQTRRDAVLAEAKWEESQGRGDIP